MQSSVRFDMAVRRHHYLRGIKAIYFGTLINCTVLAMVLLAATRLAEPFLLWHEWLPVPLYDTLRQTVEWLGVPFSSEPRHLRVNLWILSTNNLLSIGILVLVTLLYSTTGGLRSVVATDLAQFFIAITGSFLFAWYVLQEVGGFDELSQTTCHCDVHTSWTGQSHVRATRGLYVPSQAKDASFAILLAYGLQWLLQMNADGTGYLAQRSMACRSDHDAKQAAVIFTLCANPRTKLDLDSNWARTVTHIPT